MKLVGIWLILALGSATAHAGEDTMLATKKILTLKIAKLMAQSCEDYAAENKIGSIAVAIVDDGGNLVLFAKQESTLEGSARFARLKAQTSGLMGSKTRDIGDKWEFADPNRPMGIANVADFTVTPGGMPIFSADGQLLGGIGVSGAAAEDDEACGQAGIDAVADLLK